MNREPGSYIGMMYSAPQVDRIWGIWGSYYNIPKAIFYLLNGDYRVKGQYLHDE